MRRRGGTIRPRGLSADRRMTALAKAGPAAWTAGPGEDGKALVAAPAPVHMSQAMRPRPVMAAAVSAACLICAKTSDPAISCKATNLGRISIA